MRKTRLVALTLMLAGSLALGNPVRAIAAEQQTATETTVTAGDNTQSEDTQVEDKAEDTQADDKTEDTQVEDKAEDTQVEDKTEDTQVEDKTEDTQVEDKAEDTQVEDKAEDTQVEDKAEDTQVEDTNADNAKAETGIVGNADKTAGFSMDFGNNNVTTEVEVKQPDENPEETVDENPSDKPEDVTIPENQTTESTTPAPTSEPEATTTSDNKEDKVVENPEEKSEDPTVEEHSDNEPKIVPQQPETKPAEKAEETKEEGKQPETVPTVSENETAPAPTPAPVKVVEDKKDDPTPAPETPAETPKKVRGGNGGGRSSKKVTPVVIIKEESEPTPAPKVVIPDAVPQAVAQEVQDVYVPDAMPKAVPVPKTGDCSPIAVYAMIFFGSLIALAVFLLGAICGAARVLVSSHVVCDINGNKEAAAASILFEQVEDALVRNNRHVRNVNEAKIHLAMNSVRRALGIERVQRNVTFDWCDEGNIIPSASVAAEHSANQLFCNSIRSNAVK